MNIENHFKNKANSKSHTSSAFLISDCYNMRWFFAFLLICFLFVNCTHPTKKVTENTNDYIKEIDVSANLSRTQKVNLADIASSIEYCVLELNDNCLVTPDFSFYATDDYVIAINEVAHSHSTPVCYVFERTTGKFVHQISRPGQGPGDYLNLVGSFWDREKEQICVRGSNGKYIFYNLDGTISHQTELFESYNGFVAFEDYYAAPIINILGNNTIRIAFYDKTGTLIDSIPNNRFWEKTQIGSAWSRDGWLYTFDNSLHLKDIYCDTLYQIKDFELHPRYLFNTGGLAIPYEIQEGGRYFSPETRSLVIENRYEKYMYIMKILENNKYLYFTVDYKKQLYPALYDKIEDKTKIMSPVSYPIPPPSDKRVPLCGLENDLDGGLPFWPHQMISDKEIMSVYTPEELLVLDVSKITDPRLKNVLNSIDEESNPIIAIVTLKD